MKIRFESDQDKDQVWSLNNQSFPSNAEANLVDELRSSANCISLVAESDGEIVGHILFSPVSLENFSGLSIMGLAPMAVLPEEQNGGIGSLLVKRGIEECKVKQHDAIVVLGHLNYYPRFGFLPSKDFDIKSEYDVPDEVFMIKELNPDSLSGAAGTIKYHDALRNV